MYFEKDFLTTDSKKLWSLKSSMADMQFIIDKLKELEEKENEDQELSKNLDDEIARVDVEIARLQHEKESCLHQTKLVRLELQSASARLQEVDAINEDMEKNHIPRAQKNLEASVDKNLEIQVELDQLQQQVLNASKSFEETMDFLKKKTVAATMELKRLTAVMRRQVNKIFSESEQLMQDNQVKENTVNADSKVKTAVQSVIMSLDDLSDFEDEEKTVSVKKEGMRDGDHGHHHSVNRCLQQEFEGAVERMNINDHPGEGILKFFKKMKRDHHDDL